MKRSQETRSRAGTKIQDLLTGNDPWKGLDCGRSNCFLCNTKVLTGKGLKQDCRKRNIVYEIKCISCEELEKEKIQEKYSESPEILKEMLKKIRIYKYCGESHRSAY